MTQRGAWTPFLVLAWCLPCFGQAESVVEFMRLLDSGEVGPIGRGVVVGRDDSGMGTVVTVNHVIEAWPQNGLIRLKSGESVAGGWARFLAPDSDFAIVNVPLPEGTPVVAVSEETAGAYVFNLAWERVDTPLIIRQSWLDCFAYVPTQGESGGGVFNERGELVSLVRGFYRRTEANPKSGYPLEAVRVGVALEQAVRAGRVDGFFPEGEE